jgi:hypothetical protein
MGGSKQTGGCQCGAVRYRLTAAPTGASICHCRMCQKATGSPYGAYAPMAREALVFTRGAVKIFRSSEIAERGFCAECGTPLTYRNVTSRRISVTICSLDDPELAPPESQLDPAAAVSWVRDCLTKPAESVEDFLKARGVTEVGARQHPDHD